MIKIFSHIRTLGPQFVDLFGEAWEVWACWRKYVTGGRPYKVKVFPTFSLLSLGGFENSSSCIYAKPASEAMPPLP